MTLEEAIKHCEAVAKEREITAKYLMEMNKIKVDGMLLYDTDEYESCMKSAKEHRQLAAWLIVLKEIWDSGGCNDCRNEQCEWIPKLGQPVRYNCPHYVGVADKEE